MKTVSIILFVIALIEGYQLHCLPLPKGIQIIDVKEDNTRHIGSVKLLHNGNIYEYQYKSN